MHTVYADYFQVSIEDASVFNNYYPDWNGEEINRKLAEYADGLGLSIMTARNTETNIKIKLEKPSETSLKNTDISLINKSSIVVLSEEILLSGGTDGHEEAVRIKLSNGKYNVIVTYNLIDDIDPNGLGGNDYYVFYLWKQ